MSFYQILNHFDLQQLSDLTGTASFIVWLFAQSPQLYENYKNSSCEGLSFVFLAQWMAGDATNLLGSVLTKQLPFQIAVAAYFCSIDVCILIQYYYYWQRDRRIAKRRGRSSRRIQHEIYASEEGDAEASNSEPIMKQRGRSVKTDRVESINSTNEENENQEVFNTRRLNRKSSRPNKHRRAKSGSVSRPSISRSSTNATLTPLSTRQSGMILLGLGSLFVLNGFQQKQDSFTNNIIGSHSNSFKSGNVIGDLQIVNFKDIEKSYQNSPQYVSLIHPSTHKWMLDCEDLNCKFDKDQMTLSKQPLTLLPQPEKPTWERFIGRISAWTCTILYMTSRLPQIWTNMQRRSVQGLSILLFFSAAIGNLLYSISILINPRAHSPPFSPQERFDYLMESLPFLLGSGGTLIFDAIIILQWILWRGKPPSTIVLLSGNGTINGGIMIPSTGSYNFYQHRSESNNGQRSRKSSVRSRWQSLERQPLLQ